MDIGYLAFVIITIEDIATTTTNLKIITTTTIVVTCQGITRLVIVVGIVKLSLYSITF